MIGVGMILGWHSRSFLLSFSFFFFLFLANGQGIGDIT